MTKLKNHLNLLCCLIASLFFSNLSAQTITCANRAEVTTDPLCLGCGVTNPDSAVDCSLTTVANLSAMPILTGGVTFDLFFDGFSGTAGDTVEVFLANADVNSLAATEIRSFASDGTGEISPNNDQRPLTQTTIVQQGSFIKLTFKPEAAYAGIRLFANAANGNGSDEVAFDVGKVQVVQNAPIVFLPVCELPNTQTNSLGAPCADPLCSVENPDAILTETEDDFTTLRIGATLAGGTAEVTGNWDVAGCDQDSVRIVLASNTNNGTVTVNALQGGNVVATLNIVALGSQPTTFFLHPMVPFDAVQVELDAGALNLTETSIRVHAICMARVVPPRPLTRLVEACDNESVTLDVIPFGNEVARWYTQPMGGMPVFTGNSFTTGPLNMDTTFYYDGFIPGSNGCMSSFRDSIQVNVAPPTPPAGGVAGTLVACFNEQFTVAPLPEGNVFTFFTVDDTTELITGNNFTFPMVLSDTAILIQNTLNGRCGSDSLVRADIQLYDEPVITNTLDSIGVCLDMNNNQPIGNIVVSVLDESPTGFNTVYKVYDRDTNQLTAGGNPVEFVFGESVTLLAAQFNVTGVGPGFVDTIYIDAVSGPCDESINKQPIILYGVFPTMVVPQADDVFVCDGDAATLTVNNVDPQLNYYWYDAATGGNLLFSGVSIDYLSTGNVDTLYVEGTYGFPDGSCTTPGRDTVVVTPLSAAGNPFSDLNVITCSDSTAVFDLTNSGVPGTYDWYTTPQGGFPIFTGDSFVTPIVTEPTTYYLEVSNVFCKTRIEANVDTITPPTVAVGDGLRYACLGDSVTLTATTTESQATFAWFDNPVINAGNLLSTDNPFIYQTDFSNSSVNNVYVGAQVDQCFSSDLSLVRVENITDRQEPTIVAPDSVAICEGGSATFTVDPQLNQSLVSYSWWNAPAGGTRLSNTASFSTPSLNASRSYYAMLELNDPLVCADRGRSEVKVEVYPQLATPMLNQTCSADEDSVIYTWAGVPGATSYQFDIIITDPNENVTQRGGTTTGTTWVVDTLIPNSVVQFELRALGILPCQTSRSTFKTCVSNACGLNDLAAEQAFYQACENEVLVIAITGVPDNAQVELLGQSATVINNGNGRYSASVLASDIPGDLEGRQTETFRVSIPNVAGCEAVDINIEIQVLQTPEGNIEVTALDPAVIGGRINEFQFISNFTGGDQTWFWDFGDGSTSNEKNPYHEFEEDGTYTVRLVVNQNTTSECTAADEIEIVVTSIPDLFVPNTFTPNGDGANDEWRVFGRNLVSDGYNARIFNSYGNVVFETNDLEEAWDGTHEGEPAKMGAYYYTVIVFDAIGQKLEREGTLNLIRK